MKESKERERECVCVWVFVCKGMHACVHNMCVYVHVSLNMSVILYIYIIIIINSNNNGNLHSTTQVAQSALQWQWHMIKITNNNSSKVCIYQLYNQKKAKIHIAGNSLDSLVGEEEKLGFESVPHVQTLAPPRTQAFLYHNPAFSEGEVQLPE